MFVIFPADELILMTYGPAIPRLASRPTLDCLREPEVPIEVPPRSLPPSSAAANATSNAATNNKKRTASFSRSATKAANTTTAAAPDSSPRSVVNSGEPSAAPVFTTAFTYDPAAPPQSNTSPNASNSLPPTPNRRTSRTSLTHSASAVPTPNATPSKRSSERSNKSQQQQEEQLLKHLQLQKQQLQQQLKQNNISPRNTLPNTTTTTTSTQMQNNAAGSSQSLQGRPGGQRPTLERSTAVRGTTPQRGMTPQRGATPQLSHEYDQMDEHASGGASLGSGGGQLVGARDRSPSIFLEPPSPDPTQIVYGPGWGRPMSPMNLPPEPKPKSPTPSKSSRLRPKLHLPLGRLGRSTSTDQRESNRLKEDLQLLVDNPVFNCENLRQRNFDAFFESGEPKYKLQPKTPNSAPTGSLSSASSQYSPQMEPRSREGGGGLFAPSPNEGKMAMNSRQRSADQPEMPSRDRRAASVSSGVVPQKVAQLVATEVIQLNCNIV
ncbi:PREDICTED: serine/arginine repetitive matrix protein 1-like [Rhagoletis zephyria]|uniref:serine/arginine repetitive matrix protein 1-like n=1 Tax=Rhagoletis zephyria TaxID=28612 RepID=UPI0008113F98|nr:PREDICTED: serine/arginine repetitive matrix protein 1-like [Rhagoletis zephyria]